MISLFDDNEEKKLSISYTKATLPYNNKEYALLIAYGLSDKNSMKLLTNIKLNNKKYVIKIVCY